MARLEEPGCGEAQDSFRSVHGKKDTHVKVAKAKGTGNSATERRRALGTA